MSNDPELLRKIFNIKRVEPIRTDDKQSKIIVEDEIIDLGENFDFNGFQVVRREFFAHLRDPSICFNNYKLYVNSACLSRFPDTDYVQVLINQDAKVLALMPSQEGEKDSFQWCRDAKGKRTAKQVSCKLFFAKIVDLMGWNPNYRYKLLGKEIKANGSHLIAFDLTATEVYPRSVSDDGKVKSSRIPVYPEGWKNQFGLSYDEHQQYMKVNVFDGYAVISVTEQPDISQTEIANIENKEN